MNKYPIALCSDHPDVHFEHRTAARLARVRVSFIRKCEREELLTSRIMLHGKRGLCSSDVCKLKRIRHLHEDMGLDLEAVDFVLRYQDCIKIMKNRLDEMERHRQQMEQEYRKEMMTLRQRLSKLSK